MTAVAWDSKNQFIYLLDKGLKKVFKCEPSGAIVASWGETGTGPGQFQSPQAWEDLAAGGPAECPVCGGSIRVAVGCSGCGSDLS